MRRSLPIALLAKLEKLVAINKRLADPRGLTEVEAKKLAQEGQSVLLRREL